MSAKNKNSIAYSDFIRFLVLYKYRGLYTDGDIFYLRDMSPFIHKDFVHRWSATEDYNTAVMGLNSKRIDKIYKEIFKNIDRTGLNLVDGFHPSRIKDAIKKLNNGDIFSYINLKVYHSVVFDPAWLCNDGVLPRLNDQIVCEYPEFYNTVINDFDIKKFYNGAFSFHVIIKNNELIKLKLIFFF
jgi:WD repeat and SOF domain-containing protein 1